jgi:hypothetical protein
MVELGWMTLAALAACWALEALLLARRYRIALRPQSRAD